GGHDEREQTLNQLLAEMDGFDSSKGVIIMAATNRPEVLDLALLRPGRFDRQVVVDKPDIRGREAILRLHARAVVLAPHVELAALGMTYQLPTEDRFLLTRGELEDRIAVLLGGRVAEELVYGEVSTGAHNDLERATELARLMVTKYGMSERLGLATYGERSPLFLKANGLGGERDFSDATARTIDEEVRAILDRTHDRVRGLLTTKKSALVAAAGELKRVETLEGEALRRLLNGEAAATVA